MGLGGYAHYYEVQAKEEIDHGLLIYKYLHLNNEKVELMIIKANTVEFTEIKEVLDYGLKAEEDVTKRINAINDAAIKVNDYRTMEFISWFIKEQLEEEVNAQKMIDEYELFTNSNGLFTLDRNYSTRSYVKPSMEIY